LRPLRLMPISTGTLGFSRMAQEAGDGHTVPTNSCSITSSAVIGRIKD